MIRRPRSLLLIGLVLVTVAAGRPHLRAAPPDQSGAYELVAGHSGKCLDVSGASTEDGAQVVQWTCNGGLDQRWTLQPAADGYYNLIAAHSGKALDVTGMSVDDGAQVIQYTINGGANQQWLPMPVGGGYYTLTARHSGKALDVSGVSVDDGAPVIQWTLNGGANQQWLLRAASGAGPSSADVTRFLEQATWGPTPALVQHVQSVGFERFLEEQFDTPASSYPTLPLYPTTRDQTACPNGSTCVRDNYTMYPVQNRFFVNALYGPDQLRQRVAFALHQIIVVSGVDITQPSWMTPYLQVLDRNAFGNYRQLLRDITLNPAMGNYLDVNNNTKTRPNENYAREILQLFSIGTVRLNLDGTPQLDDSGQPIPTYDQTIVNNFARVFTGWRFAPGVTGTPNYIDPMVVNEAQHDTASKTLLNGTVLPAARKTAEDLDDGIDNIFNDPNVGPFISKLLIQHLVTSNPTPAYVARVASVFNGWGGARGDLRAVVKAILLDPEARGDVKTDANYGRLRHPAQFIVNILRAFGARSADGNGDSDGYLNPQSVQMGMDVFRPPSVFSYFSPGTVVPGTNGVRGPEFGLFTTSTALRRANFVNTMVFSRIAVSTNAPTGTSIDLSGMQALAGTPAQLVDALNTLLMHGTMSTEMRQSIITAVSAVSANNPLKRARTAAYLVATSSQYQVER
ncbi:MAG TPA: DUF1800 family protein [Vicinamibacterales bacterium]|jgi:uncharacterized protein (DUF1800 family)|nr:DUF1800 family protein [Vicinamibacterales bacterium]